MKLALTALLAVSTLGLPVMLTAEGAAQSNPFRRMLGQEVQAVERSLWFERADGRGGFVFDRSAPNPLILPDDGEEIYAVERARAAGGGEVWLTDTGRVMLRRSNLGGWTFFPSDRPDGVIVEPVGQAQALVALPVNEGALEDAANDMVEHLARLSRNEIRAEMTALDPMGDAFMIDTMMMIERAADRAPRRALRSLSVVRMGVGEAPRAQFDGEVLDVSIAPEQGYAGRPSSAIIRQSFEMYVR